MINPSNIRSSFPFFTHHPGLIYLDNAATTQKPASVIRGMTEFYEMENVNIHRGIYDLAARTSQKYEQVREKVAQFIGAAKAEEIVFTSGTTAGINLVAQSFLLPRLSAGDEVIISTMEHHANLIPWQQVCRLSGAKLRVIPISREGELDIPAFKNMLSDRVKMVAVVHISNTLGTINPVEEIIGSAHAKDIPVLVDGAQSAAHYEINVRTWGADFFTFSGHKLYGPTGIGVLYGKEEHLVTMQPCQFGGDAIRHVSFKETTFANAPRRFEPGTPNIAGVIGLGYAIDFLQELDQKAVRAHLASLTETATASLQQLNGLKIIGTAKNKSAIISFILGQIHPHDVATFLGAGQIAVRAGHHCTQPLMDHYGIPGTTRASFAVYNTKEEIEKLVAELKEIQAFFA